jgi:hypothetical protein
LFAAADPLASSVAVGPISVAVPPIEALGLLLFAVERSILPNARRILTTDRSISVVFGLTLDSSAALCPVGRKPVVAAVRLIASPERRFAAVVSLVPVVGQLTFAHDCQVFAAEGLAFAADRLSFHPFESSHPRVRQPDFVAGRLASVVEPSLLVAQEQVVVVEGPLWGLSRRFER